MKYISIHKFIFFKRFLLRYLFEIKVIIKVKAIKNRITKKNIRKISKKRLKKLLYLIKAFQVYMTSFFIIKYIGKKVLYKLFYR